jgi:hypothetical protein
MSFASGTTFVGYAVQRPLSSDETGDLYLAQHPRLPHWNALKVLSATLTEDREFHGRFMRETPIANGPYHLHIHPETTLFACLGPDGTPAKQTTAQVIWLQHAHGALRGTMTVTVESNECSQQGATIEIPAVGARCRGTSRSRGARAAERHSPRAGQDDAPRLIRAARPGSAETQRQVSERESL